MATFRISTFYGQAAFGWSETFWRDSPTIEGLHDFVEQLLALRAATLSQRVNFLGVRLSEDGNKRSSRLFIAGTTEMVKNGPVLAVPPNGLLADRPSGQDPLTFDQVRAALQLEVLIGSRRLAFRYFCGIPDQVSGSEPDVTNFGKPASWWTAFNAWRNYASTNFTVRTTRTYAAGEDRPITKWVQQDAAPGLVGIQTDFAPALSPKNTDKVTVTGARLRAPGFKSPNGVWQVDSVVNGVAPTQTIYLRNSTSLDITQIITPGTVRIQVKAFVTITDLKPFRVGIHKRGGPFGQLLGRRKTTKLVG